MPKRKTTEEFIAEAKNIHGDKYDYSKVEYVNSSTKVCIICPEHGEFWVTPNNHISASNQCGCPRCAIKQCADIKRKSLKEFIKEAKEIHGDKYDYSKVEYIDAKTKICIICHEHGEFWQTPDNHLQGKGCPKCAFNYKADLNRKQLKQFIEDSKNIYGDKYDYSKAEYINAHTKVCIICSEHDEFWVTPHCHLGGCGCPICKESRGEKAIRVWCEQHNLIKNKDYICQYRANWLGRLSLDFFFPKLNIGIEYDGVQHFKAVAWFGGNKGFNFNIERDTRKNNLCKHHGIKLIRIPYTEINNIESILNETLLR